MLITNQGIEHMAPIIGFTKIPSGDKIEAVFSSAVVYCIQGISIKNLSPQSFEDISYIGEKFSFAFGNSINEIFKKLLDIDFVENEKGWQREKKANPPYLMIHFNNKVPSVCTSGYCKIEKDRITTLQCFKEVSQALKKEVKKVVPLIISSLTVQMSKIHKTRFTHIQTIVYGKANSGELIFDKLIGFSAEISTSIPILPMQMRGIISDSIKQFSIFNTNVANFFHAGLKEDDRFKKFLYLFLSLEIYTNKTFKKFTQKDFNNEIMIPERLSKTGSKICEDIKDKSKNLAQKFRWCAVIKWKTLEDSDLEWFEQIKKKRDKLVHGEEVEESVLPIEELENLLLKIL